MKMSCEVSSKPQSVNRSTGNRDSASGYFRLYQKTIHISKTQLFMYYWTLAETTHRVSSNYKCRIAYLELRCYTTHQIMRLSDHGSHASHKECGPQEEQVQKTKVSRMAQILTFLYRLYHWWFFPLCAVYLPRRCGVLKVIDKGKTIIAQNWQLM